MLEKSVLVQALPTIVAKGSRYFDNGKNKYFTHYKDKQGNKLNTARVVTMAELGIELSYTVESSFWCYRSSGISQKQSRKLMTQDTYLKAGADLLSGVFNVTFTTQKLQAMKKSML